VLEDFETLFDHFVAGLVLDVGDHADAAGVMFLHGIVKTLGFGAAGNDATVFDQSGFASIGFRGDRRNLSVLLVCHVFILASDRTRCRAWFAMSCASLRCRCRPAGMQSWS